VDHTHGKRRFLLSSAIFLGIFDGLLLSEVLLRLIPAYSLSSMVSHVHAVEGNESFLKQYRPSNVFGYELIPNAGKEVNSLGMRDIEYPLKKPEGAVRVLVLGDSITEWGKWTEYLEEKLLEKGKYEVMNAGVGGWGFYHYWKYLKLKGIEFSPDFLLLGLCLNDFDGAGLRTVLIDKKLRNAVFFSLAKGDGECLLKMNPFLFANSSLYRFIFYHFVVSRNMHSRELDYPEMLNEIRSITKYRVAAVIFPYLKPWGNYNRDEKKQYFMMTELLKNAGIEFLDLMPSFQREGEYIYDFRKEAKDQIHFNDEGDKKIAGELISWLKKRI